MSRSSKISAALLGSLALFALSNSSAHAAEFDLFKVKEVSSFINVVVNPAVKLLFAAATLYFAFGVFTFIRKSDDSDGRTDGANHILWGTVGLFIMISVWSIIAIIQKTFN